MAEQEGEHRRSLELIMRETDAQNQVQLVAVYSRNSKWGLIAASWLGFCGIAGGIALAWIGRDLAGFGVIFTAAASLVGAFIAGRSDKTKNKKE